MQKLRNEESIISAFRKSAELEHLTNPTPAQIVRLVMLQLASLTAEGVRWSTIAALLTSALRPDAPFRDDTLQRLYRKEVGRRGTTPPTPQARISHEKYEGGPAPPPAAVPTASMPNGDTSISKAREAINKSRINQRKFQELK